MYIINFSSYIACTLLMQLQCKLHMSFQARLSACSSVELHVQYMYSSLWMWELTFKQDIFSPYIIHVHYVITMQLHV